MKDGFDRVGRPTGGLVLRTPSGGVTCGLLCFCSASSVLKLPQQHLRLRVHRRGAGVRRHRKPPADRPLDEERRRSHTQRLLPGRGESHHLYCCSLYGNTPWEQPPPPRQKGSVLRAQRSVGVPPLRGRNLSSTIGAWRGLLWPPGGRTAALVEAAPVGRCFPTTSVP